MHIQSKSPIRLAINQHFALVCKNKNTSQNRKARKMHARAYITRYTQHNSCQESRQQTQSSKQKP